MKIASGHLGYCTNVHPAPTWPELHGVLERDVPAVRDELGVDALGLGLWVSGHAAGALAAAESREIFSDALRRNGLYLFSLNGFPYGPFHGAPVKQAVYEPDWRSQIRVDHTLALAHLLSEHTSPGALGTISTVPGCYRPHANDEARAHIARNLLCVVAGLWHIEETTGAHIELGLEPEPACMLETTEELISFLESMLTTQSLAPLARETGLSRREAEAIVRDHLGICLDVCHAAVEYEDPVATIDRLEQAEVEIVKVQLSNAIEVEAHEDAVELLRPFADDVYLHQVVVLRDDETLVRFTDLEPALTRGVQPGDLRFRVHVHVPLFAEPAGDLQTTRDELLEVLARHRLDPVSEHLEVETYTWDVLPPDLRDRPLHRAVADEMRFVLAQIGEGEPPAPPADRSPDHDGSRSTST